MERLDRPRAGGGGAGDLHAGDPLISGSGDLKNEPGVLLIGAAL